MKVLDCEGTYADMGRAQGEWLKPLVDPIFKTFLETEYTPFLLRKLGTPSVMKGLFTVLGFKHLIGLLGPIRIHAPSQFQRLLALSQSASLNLAALLTATNIEITATQFQYVAGCSSIGFHPKRLSKKGGPILAYNHDFPSFFRDYVFLRRSKPSYGLHSLQLTYPILTGAIAGVNDAGLGVSLNHAFAVERQRPGVPITMLVQEVLDRCKNVGEAVEFLKKAHPSCGSIMTLVDEKGDMAAVELACSNKSIRKAVDGIMLSINQYETKSLKKIQIPQNALYNPKKFPSFFHGLHIHCHNWSRSRRFEELLAGKKSFSLEDIRTILMDHDRKGTPSILSICRHHETGETLASTMIFPKERKMKVAHGKPCEGEYRDYSL